MSWIKTKNRRPQHGEEVEVIDGEKTIIVRYWEDRPFSYELWRTI